MLTEQLELTYENLYLQYRDKVFRYIRSRVTDSNDAEDLLSVVFVKAMEHYSEYDAKKASISTWIYTITHNTVCDYYRKRASKGNTIFLEDIGYDLFVGNVVEEAYLEEERLEELSHALDKLGEQAGDLILLRYYQGLSLKEAAAALQISYANAKYIHHTAMKKLQCILR